MLRFVEPREKDCLKVGNNNLEELEGKEGRAIIHFCLVVRSHEPRHDEPRHTATHIHSDGGVIDTHHVLNTSRVDGYTTLAIPSMMVAVNLNPQNLVYSVGKTNH